jgi:hypothetical protein
VSTQWSETIRIHLGCYLRLTAALAYALHLDSIARNILELPGQLLLTQQYYATSSAKIAG